MIRGFRVVAVASALFFCGPLILFSYAQQPQTETPAVHIIGLAGPAENARGNLKVVNGTLRFGYAKNEAAVAAASIEDVLTGEDSQAVIGGALGTVASIAAPFGSGSALPLIRKKLDTLTIQYRDADGGLHGVIFTMPRGRAETIKEELIANGARTSVPIPAELKRITTESREEKR